MKTNHNKATPRAYHTLRQIVQRIPRWLIEKTANAYGVDARKFSETSHFVMLILGHLSRASCLTEICDDADLNKRKLSLVRIEAGKQKESLVAILDDDFNENEAKYRNGVVTAKGVLVRKPRWDVVAKGIVEVA